MGFYTHNGCEFVNIKMYKLNARLGITIRYGPFSRLDLGHTALTMSKRNETAMIGDLHNMICVMKRVDSNSME